MPRRPRVATGGYVYHVLNRGVARLDIFEDEGDYAAFERVLDEAVERMPGVRLLGYCLMSNHWHLLLYPRRDGELSEFMRWLTVTHTQRWHAHHHTSGTGPLYQGRFKSFPIQTDEHFFAVARYVERNALRAKLVKRAENWRWCSLWRRRHPQITDDVPALSKWPIAQPSDWLRRVNRVQTQAELESLRLCVNRGRPFGSEAWVKRTAKRLDMESTLRNRGRPRKPRPRTRK